MKFLLPRQFFGVIFPKIYERTVLPDEQLSIDADGEGAAFAAI
jgi:hypothetical protein